MCQHRVVVQSPVSEGTWSEQELQTAAKNPNASATLVLAGEMGAAPAGLCPLAGSDSPEPPMVGCCGPWSPWSLVGPGAPARDIFKKGKKGAEGCRGGVTGNNTNICIEIVGSWLLFGSGNY